MKLKNCIYASLFAALTFICTAFAKIPLAGAGYVHLGDTFVFLSAALLPLPYAMVASALGAALADLAAGFANYAIITAVVKALMVVVVWAVYRRVRPWWALVLGLVAATIVLGEGYFFFEWATLGVAVAWTDLPFNLLQGTVCAAVAFPLTKIVGKLHLFDEPQTATADDRQPDSQNKE